MQPLSVNKEGRYEMKRSILKNLLLSMLAFGFLVGLLFPPFANIILKSEKALSPLFFFMCVLAGLLVGMMNFIIFRVIVSRELYRVQSGMHQVHANINNPNVIEEGCGEGCLLEVTSADIIGDITQDFNEMTLEIFKRLQLEEETRKLNRELIQSAEVEDVALTILKRIGGAAGARSGLLYGGTLEKMELLAQIGVDKDDTIAHLSEDQFGPIHQALVSGEIAIFSMDAGWDWFSQTTPLGILKPASIILIPLLAKQRAVGVIVLTSGKTTLETGQINTINILRSYAAPFLDNSLLHRKISELAAVDDLTMILNRRFGLRRMREEFSRATRHGIALSAIMVDIDHFKKFNDTFGHNAGDVVLKQVAAILNDNIRSEDMVCRYGGEEFLICLSGAGLMDAAVISERIRRIVQATEVKWADKKLQITVSMGIATYPIARASVCEELITYADKALYGAKEYGRNQVVAHNGTDLVPFASLEINHK